MKIQNEFTVHVPIETAWKVLTDLEVIAPCLPGAQLTGRDGDNYEGRVKIKMGPVASEFAGVAAFSEKDDLQHRAVIEAKGRDARGAGNASATITAQCRAEGDTTVVNVNTDLKISGKLAQMGGSMINEVSEKLLGQFVTCLEGKFVVPAAPAAPAADAGSSAPSSAPAPSAPAPRASAPVATAEPEALDLMQFAGKAVAKRAIPVVIGLVVIGILIAIFAS